MGDEVSATGGQSMESTEITIVTNSFGSVSPKNREEDSVPIRSITSHVKL